MFVQLQHKLVVMLVVQMEIQQLKQLVNSVKAYQVEVQIWDYLFYHHQLLHKEIHNKQKHHRIWD